MPTFHSSFSKLLVILALAVACLAVPRAQGSNRAAWMQGNRFGVMTHYLSDWRARTDNVQISVETWNDLIDHFDVNTLADQLKSVGASYYVLTLGQNSGYYDSPNATYDRIVGIKPTKLSKRDLIGDMANALAPKGIKLIAYLPSGAPNGDKAAREALQWQNGAHPNKEFQKKWEAVIREWSKRWGPKVSGWWFDGAYWPNTMYRSAKAPNFESFAAAARTGNPNSAVCFNPGVVPRLISVTPYEDYTCGELSDPEHVEIRRVDNGMLDGVQPHILSYLGRTWGMGEPRFTTEKAVEIAQTIHKAGASTTWDVPLLKNGTIPQAFVDQLKAIGARASATN